MLQDQVKKVILALFLCAGLTATGILSATVLPPLAADQRKLTRNLILVLDIKQEERLSGLCGRTLAVALHDEVAPIIASAYTLSFIEEEIEPEQWIMYRQDTLLLFMPKRYLNNNFSELSAGFILDGWQKLSYTPMKGSALYATMTTSFDKQKTFDDLSAQTTAVISKSLNKDKNCRWKIFAVGHGAPDAHQVCGLNLNNFKELLNQFEQDIETDFFIYQTCYGGGPEQLKKVYADHNDIFKKFSFPIISATLTNNVSFAFPPFTGVSLKSLFAHVNSSIITQNKTRRLLKAMNAITKSLDAAKEYRWSNNLLLIRLPGSELFEPVADNKSVFKLSEFSSINEKSKEHCANSQIFKCMLINKPVFDTTLDLTQVRNFMIASGIPQDIHYIKELLLAEQTNNPIEDLISFFNSLIMPEKDKVFFIEKVAFGNITYSDVKIVQKGLQSQVSLIITETPVATLEYWCYDPTHNHVIKGLMQFCKNENKGSKSEIISGESAQRYRDDFEKEVKNHRSINQAVPFGATPLSIPFRILQKVTQH